jgi:adenine-specific DNA-methyltransferase
MGMGVEITYMGTKRTLAPAVSAVVRLAQDGPMLDAFSGMCAVGEAVGSTRQVWSNDTQLFACEVAKALFTSRELPMSPLTYGDVHFERFSHQKALLKNAFKRSIASEADLLQTDSFASFQPKLEQQTRAVRNDVKRCRMRSPHLFTKIYSGTFFGVEQAIEADAIYAALITARRDNKVSKDGCRWGMIGLGRALLKVASSTGHFAQYLKPKSATFRRHIALRRRSLWGEWLASVGQLAPVGDIQWRKHNRVFNRDALSLLTTLGKKNTEVGVIYADPPYTDDQYSRFYHLLETLLLYDYPLVSGAGLYRPGRFQTL